MIVAGKFGADVVVGLRPKDLRIEFGAIHVARLTSTMKYRTPKPIESSRDMPRI